MAESQCMPNGARSISGICLLWEIKQTKEMGRPKMVNSPPMSITPFGNTKHVKVYLGLGLTRLFMRNVFSGEGILVYDIPATRRMKAVVALALLLFAQNSLQDDSPAKKACKALQDKYPKLTAYGLDSRYIAANTGPFPLQGGGRCI